jgi:hypothetical protein
MAETIYGQISKQTGKDVRLVRAAAHHPFEFFSRVMADPQDHRPFRFRYLGVFFVKPWWYKGLRSTKKVGLPPDKVMIMARVPEEVRGKVYINTKKGMTEDGWFTSMDGKFKCPSTEILFWVQL